MRISDWSSDVCSSDLLDVGRTLERTADTRHHDLIVGVRRIRNGVALRRSAATLIGRLRKCAVACDQRQRRYRDRKTNPPRHLSLPFHLLITARDRPTSWNRTLPTGSPKLERKRVV